jgi:prepilin-type N-terminal cleavage/methylation domain-containing protein/prepilin-type processing-associated H-X9-DG protein
MLLVDSESIRTRRGFTLIELLVVIAIIAILAALLFPVYTTARQAGHTARCEAHQKELYGALLMYIQDYGDKTPNENFLTYYAPTAGGPQGLFMPYVKNTAILACQKKGSYGYNICLKAPIDPKSYAWVGGAVASHIQVHREQGHGGIHSGRPISDIKYPGRMMCFVCGSPTEGIDPAGSEGNGWEWEPHDCGDQYSRRIPNIHNGGTTYAFMDGHVACLKPTGMRYGLVMATDLLDYDGDGILGTPDFMR